LEDENILLLASRCPIVYPIATQKHEFDAYRAL
jgi:hypothetical protein